MVLDRAGYLLVIAGLFMLLYGLLGGPTAQVGLIATGGVIGVLGLLLVLSRRRPGKV